jgi:hypothetical protein
MTTNEQTVATFTSGILGGLVLRSLSLAAAVALAILLVTALFSAPIPAAERTAGVSGQPLVHSAQDAPIIVK